MVPYIIHRKSTIKQSLSVFTFLYYLYVFWEYLANSIIMLGCSRWIFSTYKQIPFLVTQNIWTFKNFITKYGLHSFVTIFSILEVPLDASSGTREWPFPKWIYQSIFQIQFMLTAKFIFFFFVYANFLFILNVLWLIDTCYFFRNLTWLCCCFFQPVLLYIEKLKVSVCWDSVF